MAIVNYSYGTLVDSFSLIVSDNDPVEVTLSLKNENFPISIIFIPGLNPETNETGLVWKSEGGVVNFIFYGWSNVLGTTTSQINTHLGTTNAGENVYVVLAHHKVGDANHLNMQLILGKNAGGER